MKIRSGFVSNSSSSSFACVISIKDYIIALDSLTEQDQELINRYSVPEKQHFNNIEVYLVTGNIKDDCGLNGEFLNSSWPESSIAIENLIRAMKKYEVCYVRNDC